MGFEYNALKIEAHVEPTDLHDYQYCTIMSLHFVTKVCCYCFWLPQLSYQNRC